MFKFEVPVGVKRKFGMKRHQGFCRWGSVAKLFGLDTREGINNKNVWIVLLIVAEIGWNDA